jgi:hypothetical protein
MYKSLLFFLFFVLAVINVNLQSQTQPVLYFCAGFDSGGEKNITDRFHLGPLYVVVRCDNVIDAANVTVQFDKLFGTEFEFYKAINFKLKPKTKYTYFTDVDMRIDDPGIYRCFLLDEGKNTIASGIVEFVK